MAAHWTYKPCPSADVELEQGDILQPTNALRAVFAQVHPHFQDAKYLAFLVTTQSCDLVRRGAEPTASYVNIAAIRPLRQVIHKILSQATKPAAKGVFKTSGRAAARMLLERILNQNEQAIGLFYLNTDLGAGIGEPAIAFLRVSVALKSEHYGVLQAARVGRMGPEFQAKLGWLVGNLYVRPATPDWHDQPNGRKQLDAMIDEQLAEARWLDDGLIAAALEAHVDIAAATDDELKPLRPPTKLDRALDVIGEQFSRLDRNDPDLGRKLVSRLRNTGNFTKLFK